MPKNWSNRMDRDSKLSPLVAEMSPNPQVDSVVVTK